MEVEVEVEALSTARVEPLTTQPWLLPPIPVFVMPGVQAVSPVVAPGPGTVMVPEEEVMPLAMRTFSPPPSSSVFPVAIAEAVTSRVRLSS